MYLLRDHRSFAALRMTSCKLRRELVEQHTRSRRDVRAFSASGAVFRLSCAAQPYTCTGSSISTSTSRRLGFTSQFHFQIAKIGG